MRYYLHVFSDTANRYLDEMIRLYGNTPKAESEFRNGLARLGRDLYSDYQKQYPGSHLAQISIRLSHSFHSAVNVAMDYLEIGFQEFARIALCIYVNEKYSSSPDVFELKRKADALRGPTPSASASPKSIYEDVLSSMGGR